MKKLYLLSWPHNGGRFQSAAGISLVAGESVEVPDEVAYSMGLDFGAFFEVRPVTAGRLEILDALKAGGISDKVIGYLEVAGLLGPHLLAANLKEVQACKGLGKASASKVLEALAPIRA